MKLASMITFKIEKLAYFLMQLILPRRQLHMDKWIADFAVLFADSKRVQ